MNKAVIGVQNFPERMFEVLKARKSIDLPPINQEKKLVKRHKIIRLFVLFNSFP